MAEEDKNGLSFRRKMSTINHVIHTPESGYRWSMQVGVDRILQLGAGEALQSMLATFQIFEMALSFTISFYLNLLELTLTIF